MILPLKIDLAGEQGGGRIKARRAALGSDFLTYVEILDTLSPMVAESIEM